MKSEETIIAIRSAMTPSAQISLLELYARLQIEKDRERVKAQNKDIYIVIDTVPIILD